MATITALAQFSLELLIAGNLPRGALASTSRPPLAPPPAQARDDAQRAERASDFQRRVTMDAGWERARL